MSRLIEKGAAARDQEWTLVLGSTLHIARERRYTVGEE
jgi:hypothetical protein